MKRILSIITAGCLALLAFSCAKVEEKAVVDISKATAPVLQSFTAEDDIVVTYTPAVFTMGFNEKMATYHTLAMVSVEGKASNVTLSTKNDGSHLTLTRKTLVNALKVRGFEPLDVVSVELVVRGAIQNPSEGITNAFVDSEGKATVSVEMPEEAEGACPYEEYTEDSNWSVIGKLSKYDIDWNGDLNMWTDGNGNYVAAHVALAADDEFKFREDQAWTVNMGGEFGGLESEFAVAQDGANIKVGADGVYDLFFFSGSGTALIAPAFDPYPEFVEESNWTVIGKLVNYEIDWNGDIPMVSDGSMSAAFGVSLTADDEFKFRQDKAWTVNLGGEFAGVDADFDVAQDGANIKVGAAGIYDLFVDPANLTAKVATPSGLKISAVIGGDEPEEDKPKAWSVIGTIGGSSWDTDIDLTNVEGDKWIARGVTVTASDEFKIRADHDWAISYGGPEENAQSTIDPENPYGVYKPVIGGTFDAGDKNIQIGEAGVYDITLNYSAEGSTILVEEHAAAYSLIGEINGDSWTKDVVMTEKDGIWSSPVVNITGGFKIRYDFSWADENCYGAASKEFVVTIGTPFTAVQPGENITLPEAGDYKVTFNPATKEVTVSAVAFPEHLYMIGAEFGGWDWASDGIVEMTPVLHNPDWGASAEGQFYTVRYFTAGEGFKFCAKRAWDGDFWGLDINDGYTEAGGNCTVAESGFYLVHIDFKAGKVHVEPARVYGIGDAFGGWDEEMEDARFVADGKVLKATVAKAANIRMYVASSIATSGWWTREFNVIEGKIVPRLMDELPGVPALANQVVKLDFNAGTGAIEGEGDAPTFKSEITVAGDYSGCGWSVDNDPKLQGKDGVFKGALVMNGGSFKFVHDGTWIGGVATDLTYALNIGGGDNMTIADGTYFWTVDLAAESPVATALAVTKVGLIGTFNGWSDDVELAFNSTDLTYSGDVTLEAGAKFKVRFNGNWDYALGGALDKLSAYGGDIEVADAGTYKAVVDLNKATVTLIPANAGGITIDGDMSDWDAISGATGTGGYNAAFKVASDANNLYFYVKRTTERMSELWGGAAYHYYTFDLDGDATNGETLWGNGPYDLILVIYPYAGSAASPAFGIAAEGATAPSTYTVANAVIKGVVTESGVETEISVPRADIMTIPTTEIKAYYWSNKGGSEKLEVSCTL